MSSTVVTAFMFIVLCLSYNIVVEEEVEPVESLNATFMNELSYKSAPMLSTETEYPAHWTCFDHAMYWSAKYPDWGMVLISKNPNFEGYKFGDNHLVNYKILPDKTLLIHDGTKKTDKDCLVSGWEYDSDTFEYYHFYVDGEVPTRTWIKLYPNAEAVY